MLTREKILKIPALRAKGLNNEDIAKELQTSVPSVIRWIKRLRESGHKVEKRTGGKPRINL